MWENSNEPPILGSSAGYEVSELVRSKCSDEDVSPSLVSIVIINFNYGRFLESAVRSALNQTYAPLEVVVVDDGSTDNSLCVLKKFEGLITVISKQRGGHVSAFNAGFAACQGEVVVFLDADDVLRPNCIARVMANWRRGLSKVQYRLDTIDADGVDQRMPFPDYPADTDLRRNQATIAALRMVPVAGLQWQRVRARFCCEGYANSASSEYSNRLTASSTKWPRCSAPSECSMRFSATTGCTAPMCGHNPAKATNREAFSRTVRFDAILHAEFVAAAARFGFTVDDYDHQPVPQWVERRQLSLRLCPERHPIADDTMLAVLRRGLHSAVVAPGLSVFGRLSWALWFILIAVLPEWSLLVFPPTRTGTISPY